MTDASTRNPNLDLDRPRHAPDPDDALVGPRGEAWWTCAMPSVGRAGVGADGTIRALRTPDLARCTREEVLDYLENGWTITDLLFSSLQG